MAIATVVPRLKLGMKGSVKQQVVHAAADDHTPLFTTSSTFHRQTSTAKKKTAVWQTIKRIASKMRMRAHKDAKDVEVAEEPGRVCQADDNTDNDEAGPASIPSRRSSLSFEADIQECLASARSAFSTAKKNVIRLKELHQMEISRLLAEIQQLQDLLQQAQQPVHVSIAIEEVVQLHVNVVAGLQSMLPCISSAGQVQQVAVQQQNSQVQSLACLKFEKTADNNQQQISMLADNAVKAMTGWPPKPLRSYQSASDEMMDLVRSSAPSADVLNSVALPLLAAIPCNTSPRPQLQATSNANAMPTCQLPCTESWVTATAPTAATTLVGDRLATAQGMCSSRAEVNVKAGKSGASSPRAGLTMNRPNAAALSVPTTPSRRVCMPSALRSGSAGGVLLRHLEDAVQSATLFNQHSTTHKAVPCSPTSPSYRMKAFPGTIISPRSPTISPIA